MTASLAMQDHVLLVTGASRGIGAAIASAAAAAGADVAVGYRNRAEAAAEVVAGVEALGRKGAAFAVDVMEAASSSKLVTDVESSFGRIDGLVNNAGVMPSGSVVDLSDAEWDTVIKTNLYGPFYCSRAAIPGMLERGSGRIVMIASRLGQIGWPELPHYSAAKAGLIGLTKSMARELGPRGIRVNAVAPGFTVTDMTRDIVDTESGKKRLAELPARRFPEPEDVAASVVFLLSDAAAAYHGQTLNPNGGGFMP